MRKENQAGGDDHQAGIGKALPLRASNAFGACSL
jgi:hypothetical protein